LRCRNLLLTVSLPVPSSLHHLPVFCFPAKPPYPLKGWQEPGGISA
jgi:hypothetical protein